MSLTRTHRALAATAALAWLVLGVAVATDWPHHHPAPAPAGASTRTERVCYRDGTASLETALPDGRRIAVSDGTCTYHPHNRSDDPEGDR